ncbi:MAG: hypothetical protein H7X77_05150, partial [Anaerolineae bacterium]|nr:hypothetical protein [Anaerolineae bacterium]
MIELALSAEDLHSTRFAYSPLVELATSYRVLKDADLQPHVDRWEEAAVRSLHGLEFPYLEMLIPGCGYVPDFLTPTPTRTDLTIEGELQKLLNMPTSIIQASMQTMIARLGDSEDRQQYLIYPHEMIACLVEDLRLYWQRA